MRRRLLVPHLGLVGHRGPVTSSQGELPAADASQNLLRCVIRAVGKRGEAAGGQDCESTKLLPFGGGAREAREEAHPVSMV